MPILRVTNRGNFFIPLDMINQKKLESRTSTGGLDRGATKQGENTS